MIITVTQLGPQPGHERRLKISRDFSLWVAMSAGRQGITVRGRQLYPHLRKIDLSSVLNAAESITPVEFSNWHKTSVEDLARSLDLPAGWAAKLINMILKVRVYVGREGPSALLGLLHPPIDNRLVDEILERYPKRNADHLELRRLCELGKPIKRMKTYDDYLNVIRGVRMVADREGCTLFEVESLWCVEDESGSADF
jgi:hypothetical protein